MKNLKNLLNLGVIAALGFFPMQNYAQNQKIDTIYNAKKEIGKIVSVSDSVFSLKNFQKGKLVSEDFFRYDKNKNLEVYRRTDRDDKGKTTIKEDFEGDGIINYMVIKDGKKKTTKIDENNDGVFDKIYEVSLTDDMALDDFVRFIKKNGGLSFNSNGDTVYSHNSKINLKEGGFLVYQTIYSINNEVWNWKTSKFDKGKFRNLVLYEIDNGKKVVGAFHDENANGFLNENETREYYSDSDDRFLMNVPELMPDERKEINDEFVSILKEIMRQAEYGDY